MQKKNKNYNTRGQHFLLVKMMQNDENFSLLSNHNNVTWALMWSRVPWSENFSCIDRVRDWVVNFVEAGICWFKMEFVNFFPSPLKSSLKCRVTMRNALYIITRDYPGLLRQSLKFCEIASSHSEECFFFKPQNFPLHLGSWLKHESMYQKYENMWSL